MSLGSLYCMPILVLNLGGEMIYILNQRLQAQNIPREKAVKVLGDVMKHMYTQVFLDELFKPQEIYSVASTKQIFDKLAHSSIMRLNKTSMDKLFDLMTMGVKYQMLSCKAPHQLLQITLNHLDSLKSMISTESIQDMIKSAIERSIELYSSMTPGNWMLLEECLFKFFQGKKVKVSLFLQRKIQSVNGSLQLNNKGILPYGTELPGDIRFFEGPKVVREIDFPSPLRQDCSAATEILEPDWHIGCNIYSKEDNVTAGAGKTAAGAKREQSQAGPFFSTLEASKAFSRTGSFLSSTTPLLAPSKSSIEVEQSRPTSKFSSQISAKAGLGMLSELLGVSTVNSGSKGSAKPEDRLFKINLFPNAEFQEKAGDMSSDSKGIDDVTGGFISMDIDASAGAKTMSTYMEIMDWKDEDEEADGKDGDEDDLLALMDSAK